MHAMVDQQQHQLHIEFWNATPHFQTSIEIALRAHSEGRSVSFASWGRYFNTTEIYHRDSDSIKKEELVLNHLGGLGIRLCAMPKNGFSLKQAHELLGDCKNIFQLETIKYMNMPVGLIVRSFLVDIFKTVRPSFASNRHLVVHAIHDLVNIYNATLNEIRNTSVERIVVFNGRYLGPSAVRFAAEALEIPVYYHERGADKNRFILFPQPVHSYRYWWYQLQEIWNSKAISTDDALEVGRNLFLQRMSGATTNWPNFTKDQKKPAYIPSESKYTITYFSSSPYEYSAIYDTTQRPIGLFKEESALFYFLQDFSIDNPSVNIVIRMHPNLVNANSTEKELFYKLSNRLSDNLTVLAPESEVNSYSLLQNSDMVVTSGATCGAEGLCLGKKVINIAPGLYSYLDSVVEPETLSEFIDELSTPYNVDSNKLSTSGYKYFYSYSKVGHSFIYYSPHDLFSGSLTLAVQPQSSDTKSLCFEDPL